MSEERTPEEIATDLRDAVDALNRMLREAAAAGYSVEIECRRLDAMDVKEKTACIQLHGVYRRVEPTPRPHPEPPHKRQARS